VLAIAYFDKLGLLGLSWPQLLEPPGADPHAGPGDVGWTRAAMIGPYPNAHPTCVHSCAVSGSWASVDRSKREGMKMASAGRLACRAFCANGFVRREIRNITVWSAGAVVCSGNVQHSGWLCVLQRHTFGA